MAKVDSWSRQSATGIALHCSATVFCYSFFLFSFRLLLQLAGLKSISLMWHNCILFGSRRTVFYGVATFFVRFDVSLWLVFLRHHSMTGLSLTSIDDGLSLTSIAGRSFAGAGRLPSFSWFLWMSANDWS